MKQISNKIVEKYGKKIGRHLHDDEEILCIGKPSWAKYRFNLLFFPLILPPILAVLRKYSTYLIVTNKRILTLDGVLSENSKGVSFAHLTTVKVHQDIRARLFDYGYLHAHTNTGGVADVNFHYLKDPITVKKEIEKGMVKMKQEELDEEPKIAI